MIVYFKDGDGIKAVELGTHQISLLEEKGLVSRVQGSAKLMGVDFEKAMQTLIEHPSALVCDFCSDTPVRWLYACRTVFTQSGKQTYEHNDWTACDDCSALIEANDWDGIYQRAAKRFYEAHPQFAEDAAEVLAAGMMMQSLHESFRKNRIGSRVAV